MEGRKEALGLWIGKGGESAKFWLKIFNDLRNRGIESICVVCCDGLTALPEAIEAVYGDAWIQCCVVHLIRINRPSGVVSRRGVRCGYPGRGVGGGGRGFRRRVGGGWLRRAILVG